MLNYFFKVFFLVPWVLAEPRVFAREAHWYDLDGISVGTKDFNQGVLGAEVTLFPVGQRLPYGVSIGKTQIQEREIYSEIEYLYKRFDRLLLVWTMGGGPMWFESKISGMQMTASFFFTPLPCVYARLQRHYDERNYSAEVGLFFKFPVITAMFPKDRS